MQSQITLHYLLVVVFRKDIDVSVADLRGRIGFPNRPATNNVSPVQPPSWEAELPSSGSERANATFVFLCRNSDLAGVVSSIQQMEDRFNRKHGYPWVLLNEEPFTEEFKTWVFAIINAHKLMVFSFQESGSFNEFAHTLRFNSVRTLVSTRMDRRRIGQGWSAPHGRPRYYLRW